MPLSNAVGRPAHRGSRAAASLLLLALALVCEAQMRVTILPAGEADASRSVLTFDALPDTRIGRGRNDIAEAWLVEPTTRYPHGALGDYGEAGGLKVRLRDGKVLAYRLPDDSVFEDLNPRVHDIDGDGRDEVLLVRSRQATGASLMALGVRNGALVPIAETPSLGTRFAWLNPIGVADVDGDGRPEILLVQRPHSSGTLVVYHFRDGQFVEAQRMSGVSNHQIGTRAIAMHALMVADRDGMPDLIVPSADRRALRVIRFSSGATPLEFTRIALPSPAAGDFVLEGSRVLTVPLEDGRRARISWP